jgi:hypothetical protein
MLTNNKKKILYDWWLGGGSQAPTFSSSTERCILAGGASGDDYVTFGDWAPHPVTGDEVYNWRFGPDHNASGTGNARIFTKAAGSSTISSPVTIYADPDGSGGVNVTNVSGNWASATRYIVFWLEINGTNGDMYYKYSDDLHLNIATPASATWSARTRMTTDFGTGQANTYIDGPGQFIVLQNGDLLKPSWCNNGIVTVYRSTDLGLTWTRSGNITLDTVNPNDETSIVQLDNGTIFAAMRCNSLHVIRTSTSTDNGATWSALVNTTIQSYGKPAICQYNNYVYGIAREYNPLPVPFTSQRTIYFKTSDLVTFETGFIDNREEIYGYGQPRVSPIEDKIIVVYSVEGANTTPLQDPTRIIRKELTYTASAATTPPVYDTDIQSWYDFIQGNYETVPTAAETLAFSNFIAGLRADGRWPAEFEEVFPLAMNDTNNANAALRGLKKPWRKGVPTASPTYTVSGYDFNGTSQYIDTGLVLSNSAILTQNSASVFYYCAENTSSAGNNFDFGAGNAAANTLSQVVGSITRFSDNNLYFMMNDSTLTPYPNANAVGFYHLQRLNSTTKSAWKNGVSMGANATVTSTVRPTTTPTIGAKRFSGSVSGFANRTIGIIGFAGALSGYEAGLNTRFQALKTALGY